MRAGVDGAIDPNRARRRFAYTDVLTRRTRRGKLAHPYRVWRSDPNGADRTRATSSGHESVASGLASATRRADIRRRAWPAAPSYRSSEVRMLQSNTVRRVAVATVVAFVAACQDATPSAPVAPALERSARAQERLEAVFQRISPDVMELPGTVFADNDEATGRIV